ncbi:hypothetical protein C8R48DRAFT_769360 [Suillus tomentosus]|nr:hypothetical protein C8R48DRAFT_769360 [Suillus tomentosus]
MVLRHSIGHFNDISWDPYLKQTLKEARYKTRGASGRPGGRGAPNIIPLSNDDFMKVQMQMHEIIKDGLEQLNMYGSCFFVLEGQDIKLLTKDSQRGQYISPSYMVECSNIIKILIGCKKKTYGVQDEYRVSGKAAILILDEIVSKAKEYVKSHPILWIPSHVWFEFIVRRVQEIQRTQINIVKENPPNLGVLTGILNHMLRATTSTPIVFDSHVHKSLTLINYKMVLETSGMLFLQEFDICSTTCLDEVQQVNNVHVLALIGVNAKAQRDREVALVQACRDDVDSESEESPLGRTPSWRCLKSAIANTPEVIMRPWIWPVMLCNASDLIEQLFIMFTWQTWLMLIDSMFKGRRPYPTLLQDAMRCWTLTSVDDTLARVTFEACNVGIQNCAGITPGCMGPRAKSFADRSAIFFPDLNTTRKDCLQWDELWRGDGYIVEYYQALDRVEEAQQATLHSKLHEVFSNLHCLPASGGSHVWQVKRSAAVFIINPAFYRMDCLGNTNNHTIRQTKAHRPMKILKGKHVFAADLMDSMHFDACRNLRVQTDRQKH